MKDQSLLQLLTSEQKERAFVKIYRYFPKVSRFICKYGGTKEEAQDVFQEALLIFYRKAKTPSFTLTSSIETYVFSICKYLWKDQLKQKNKQTDSLEETFLNDNSIPVEIHQQEEEKYQLAEKALKSIGDKCLKLLSFFYINKKKMQEIANLLGFTSESSAKTQKYKCLERAKRELQTLKANR
ncbi:sigma-70 family RNA polymerase sigma factor [uncultured Kordia sp.]|uniref:RNA polymerase sigma factor n=1 Tax=uncultured Kordia sp. TaxID=507699 RepID=UPI00263975E5|nr:sigma-70 family RNA polymerase sigma factor [uncultured Kordia sp.]